MVSRRQKGELTHERIASVLRAEIKDHRAPGDRIEDQFALCRRFGVSYMTMHKAMQILVREGIVSRIPRRGTVVAGGPTIETRTVTLLSIRAWPVNDTLKEILRGFERDHQISVRLQEVDESEYVRCVLELQHRGTSPDLVITNTWCQRALTTARALQDVRPLCDEKTLKDCDPVALATASNHARLEGLPFCLSPVVMFCNQSLFRNAGVPLPDENWKWGDFLDACKRLTSRNLQFGTVERYGYMASEDRNRWPILVLQNDGHILSDDGSRCCLDQPRAVEAIQFYRDLIHLHQVSPGPRTYSQVNYLFQSGQIGMFAAGFFALRYFQHLNAFDWNILPLPIGRNRSTYLSVINLSLPKGSRHSETYRKLAAYLLSNESQMRLGVAMDGFPLRRSLWKLKGWHPPVEMDLDWNVFLDAVAEGHPLVWKLKTDAIHAINERLHLVWSNLQPVKQACSEISKVVNPLLRGES